MHLEFSKSNQKLTLSQNRHGKFLPKSGCDRSIWAKKLNFCKNNLSHTIHSNACLWWTAAKCNFNSVADPYVILHLWQPLSSSPKSFGPYMQSSVGFMFWKVTHTLFSWLKLSNGAMVSLQSESESTPLSSCCFDEKNIHNILAMYWQIGTLVVSGPY